MKGKASEVGDCIFWGGGERGLRFGTWSLERRLAPSLNSGAWRVLRNVASVARNSRRVLEAPGNQTSLVASAEEQLHSL